MGTVVGPNGQYLNTESGLSAPGGFLDRLIATSDQAAQQNAVLSGMAPALQATGIPVQAPQPGILSRLLGLDAGSAPTAAPAAPASPAPQPMAYAGGDPNAAAGGSAMAPQALASLVGSTAQKYGIDPMTAIRVAMSEGGRSGGYGPNGIGDNGTSFSPFQLHYGGGMGDDFTKATGLDAADPKNMAAAVDYALSRAAKEGWGAFHGAARSGIGAFQGIGGAQQNGGLQQASYKPSDSSGTPMPQATADGPQRYSQPQPPQALASAGGAGGPLPLPGGLTPAAIGAMVQNPATREQGLQLWKQMLSPKTVQFGKPGEMAFVNGRPTYSIPNAPMTAGTDQRVFDPAQGRVVLQAQPKLEHTEIGRDAYGQPQFGAFDPRAGTVAPFAGAPGVVPQDGGGSGQAALPTGQAFLETLPGPIANQVKAVAEGRMTLPSGMGANSPMAQRMRSYVLQYDPNFDTTDVEARAKTRADYASGSTAQAITAGNTAIQHLGELSDAAEALHNSRIPLANAVGQAMGNATGGNLPGVAFNNILGKYVEEATKFYRGSGGTEADIQRDIGNLSPTMSPDQLRAALQAQSGLLRGKVTALQSRWKQGMGPLAGEYPVISPASAGVLGRIDQRTPNMAAYGGLGAAQQSLPQASPAGAQQPQAAGASPLDQGRAAIARGAPRDAVIQRLQKLGVDTRGL